MKPLSILFLTLTFSLTAQSPNPPCGNDYGSSQDEANIIQQMRFGTILDAQSAIELAKNTRGNDLGCPQVSYNHNLADYSEPTLAEVAGIWNSIHLPAIESFTINCPRIGRYENNAALGAYYANLAGFPVNLSILNDIAQMQMAQQYNTLNCTSVLPEHEGVFGYVHLPSNDPCYPGGVVGSSVSAVCASIPSYCVTYNNGLFSGENFLIGDQYDPLSFYDGGIAYDHGWIGAHLVEAAIQQNDPQIKEEIKNALILSAQWAQNQEVVKNHNYTSKLVWHLAQLYAWTGENTYRDELNYKLDKNLLPSVLMDADLDGNVDGTNPPIPFQDLTEIAKVPGRNWDGHNSLPWYNAMNAWALVEAYVAFRDRGDIVRAQELKPYAIATLDNLSREINTLGIIDDQLGVRDLTYAILTGIWKVAAYENEPHPDWESAAWAMWNSGYFDTYSTHSVCVGLYLCILNDTDYAPPFIREDFAHLNEPNLSSSISIYPNPASTQLTVELNDSSIKSVMLTDLKGQTILKQPVHESMVKFNVSAVSKGTYLCFGVDKNDLRTSANLICIQ